MKQSNLGLAAWGGEGCRLAVLAHAAAQERQRHGPLDIACAERHRAARLTAAIAVGALVEGVAVAVG
eukprot:scaffold36275_cov154-Isochrysis_galbana.AAC.20